MSLFAAIIAIILVSSTGKADTYFRDGRGNPIPTQEAVLIALKGQQVYKCTEVEAKISKTGSIGFRNKKVNRD